MDRFASTSSAPPPAEIPAGSNKLLSLLVILEALRQQPVPMRPQKV